MTYLDLLQSFKESGPDLRVVVGIPEEKLIKLMVAWSMTGVTFSEPLSEEPEEYKMKFRWLWSGVSFHLNKLITNFGEDLQNNILQKAILAMLIFPDGSYSEIGLDKLESAYRKKEAPR